MKRALYIGLIVIGAIVAVALVVLAYRGPTEAVQPSTDYSRTNQPRKQAVPAPSDATAADVSSATPVTAANTPSGGSNDYAAGGTTALSADAPAAASNPAAPTAVYATPSSEVAQNQAANPPAAKRGALQAIIDVVSNLQL